MYRVSLGVHTIIQKCTHCLIVGMHRSSRFHEIQAYRQKCKSPYLAEGKTDGFCQIASQGDQRDDLVLFVQDEIQESCQDHDATTGHQFTQAAETHQGQLM